MPNGIETTYPSTMVSGLIVTPPATQWMSTQLGYNEWFANVYDPGSTPVTFYEANTISVLGGSNSWIQYDSGVNPDAHFIYAIKAIADKVANLRSLGEYWSATSPTQNIDGVGLTGPQLLDNIQRTTFHISSTDNNGLGAWTVTHNPGTASQSWDIYIDPWSAKVVNYRSAFGGELAGLDYVVSHELGHANAYASNYYISHSADANISAKVEILADMLADRLSTIFPTDLGYAAPSGYLPSMILSGSSLSTLTGGTATAFVFTTDGPGAISYASAGGGVLADLTPRVAWSSPMNIYSGIVSVTGSQYNDTLVGDSGNNTLMGGAGSDSILGGDGNDYLQGNQGSDTISGNAGNDTIMGGADGDVIRGGQGNDLIVGDKANEVIYGDVGNDTMTGGEGADAFYIQRGFGQDTVTDFHQSEGDTVHVVGASYTTFQQGSDTIVQLDDGTRLALQNVSLNSLTSGWIMSS